MRRLLCVLLPVALGLPSIAYPQDDKPLWGVKIRRSAQTGSDDVSKPAVINYTRPSDGESSYAADIAASKLFWNTQKGDRSSEFSAFAELHKNTLGTKRQDTRFYGLNLAAQYGTLTKSEPIWIPRASIAYVQNEVKQNNSGLIQADLTALDRASATNAWKDFGPVSFLWSPLAGAEHQRIVKNADGSEKGHVSRLFGGLDLKFTPVSYADRLTLTLSGKLWREGGRTELYEDGSDRTKKFGSISLDWDPIGGKAALIGVSREVGENPTEDLPKSRVTKIALKLKFN